MLLDEQFELLAKPLQLDDTRTGHEQLTKWLARQIKKHDLGCIYAAVESTGGFENNWHALFIDLGKNLPVKIARLNPLVVKNAAKATLSEQGSDALSARHIAEYLIRYREQVRWQQPETKYRSFRSLDGYIRLQVRQRAQLVTQMKQLLYTCSPELQRFCKSKMLDWVLELLKKYPTAGKLARARVKTVAKINYISQKKAEDLIAGDKQSIAARSSSADGYLIASMATEIQTKQRLISRLKGKLIEACEGTEVDLLETIPGTATYSVAALMIQIEDIRRFASPSRLTGYFGVYPVLRQSGDKTLKPRMSKKGRAAMRATLYMCANNAVLHDEHLKGIYHNHRGKGKTHKQALGVIMHKLLRIIWGMLTTGRVYNADKDRANQRKHQPRETQARQKELQSKRRLQPFDEQAPVSRIATQKRKAYQQSQAGIAGQVRDPNDTPSHKHKKYVC